MNITKKVYPIRDGMITIELNELEIKNLMLDLESESKNFRTTTDKIIAELKEFLELCGGENGNRK